jgi:hypothetical protein
MISLGTGPGTRPTTLSNLMLTLGGDLPGMEQRSVSPLLIL